MGSKFLEEPPLVVLKARQGEGGGESAGSIILAKKSQWTSSRCFFVTAGVYSGLPALPLSQIFTESKPLMCVAGEDR